MYLQPNITIPKTIDLIKEKIKSNTPFALSRYGDGEIFMLNRNSPDWHQRKGCSNWGYQYPSEVTHLYQDATDVILNAIKHSDVIGLMDSKNEIAKNINYTKEKWSISSQILESNGIDVTNLIITDHMISRDEMFGKPSNFKEILQGKSLNIISPNTELLKQKHLSKLLDSNVTFTHHPHTITFKNRNKFINEFKNIDSDVVLVGCGLQKDYVSYLKYNYGKIAIDVGAMLDAWAGIISRPWFKKGGKQDYLLL